MSCGPTRPHCWKDSLEAVEDRHGYASPEWFAAEAAQRGSCMLLAGHEGPHEFTPDTDIFIDFLPPTLGQAPRLPVLDREDGAASDFEEPDPAEPQGRRESHA